MASNIRQFTINDFPTEIIERFAPDERPRTVSTLRLVSRRFREVFTADRFYRAYLYYRDKPGRYRRDLQEAGDERGRWRRCLAAEKGRLDNWRKGRPRRVEKVEFPENVRETLNIKSFKSLIGQHNEHWTLAECYDKKIVLLNLADAILTVHDMSDFTTKCDDFADLAHGQVFIKGERGATHVFNIEKQTNVITIQHHFDIAGRRARRNLIVTGRSQMCSRHTNLFLRFKPARSDGIVQVWDTKRGVKWQNLSLGEFPPLSGVFDGPHSLLTIGRGAFPNILVATGRSSVVMFNMETKQLTHSFGGTENHMLVGYIAHSDSICLGTVFGVTGYFLSLYEFGEHPLSERHTVPQPIFRFDRELFLGSFSAFETYSFGVYTIIIHIEQENKIYVVYVDDSQVIQKELTLNITLDSVPVTFVGPFLIVKSDNDQGFFTPRTYDLAGIELFRRENIIWERDINGRNFRLIEPEGAQSYNDLFKCLLLDQNNNLHICHF